MGTRTAILFRKIKLHLPKNLGPQFIIVKTLKTLTHFMLLVSYYYTPRKHKRGHRKSNDLKQTKTSYPALNRRFQCIKNIFFHQLLLIIDSLMIIVRYSLVSIVGSCSMYLTLIWVGLLGVRFEGGGLKLSPV